MAQQVLCKHGCQTLDDSADVMQHMVGIHPLIRQVWCMIASILLIYFDLCKHGCHTPADLAGAVQAWLPNTCSSSSCCASITADSC